MSSNSNRREKSLSMLCQKSALLFSPNLHLLLLIITESFTLRFLRTYPRLVEPDKLEIVYLDLMVKKLGKITFYFL